MDCPKCNNYFPANEPCCPYCGCVVTKEEHKAAQKRKKQELSQRRPDSKLKAEIAQLKADDHRVVSAVLLTTDKVTETHKGTIGTAARTLVGGALFGVFGAAVGLASGRAKTRTVSQTATFAVRYASGRTATEKVDINSRRFKELMEFIV